MPSGQEMDLTYSTAPGTHILSMPAEVADSQLNNEHTVQKEALQQATNKKYFRL